MNYTISKLKFFAAISVVLIHSSSFIYSDDMATFENYFWFRPFLEFAVPFFFAVSGYILSMKKSDYIRKYTYRIFKMFLIYSLFYLIVEIFSGVFFTYIEGHSLNESITQTFNNMEIIDLFNGTFGQVHLWYLWGLFLALILFYFFLKWRLSSTVILVISIGLFILFNALAPIRLFGGEVLISTLLYEGSFAKAIAFISVGYFVGKHDIILRRPLMYAFLSSLPFVILFNFEKFHFADQLDVLLLPSIFFLAVFFDNYKGKEDYLSQLGNHSTKIYVFHILFIYLYRDIVGYNPELNIENMYLKVIVLVIASTALSIYLYKPLSRIFIEPLNKGIDNIVSFVRKQFGHDNPQINK